MTDQEYNAFLLALGRIYIRGFRSPEKENQARLALERISEIVRLWKQVRESNLKNDLFFALLEALENLNNNYPAPVFLEGLGLLDGVREIMEDMGMLVALEEDPSLIFGEFRRSAIPHEEIEILRRALFSYILLRLRSPTKGHLFPGNYKHRHLNA